MTRVALAFAAFLGAGASAQTWVQWPVSAGGNGHWYLAVPGTPGGIARPTANDLAIATGGVLASPSTAAENAFVFSLVDHESFWVPGPDDQGAGPWLGAIKIDEAPGWQWDSGEAWAAAVWGPGEPNNLGGNEDRVLYWSHTPGQRSSAWNDWPRSRLGGGFVVEVACLGATAPASVRVSIGQSATLTTIAGGEGPLEYQWQRTEPDGSLTNLADGVTSHGSTIAGSRTASLTITAIADQDIALYRCRVSNEVCADPIVTATAAVRLAGASVARARQLGPGRPVELVNVRVGNTIDLINNGTLASATLEDDTGALTAFGPNPTISPIADLGVSGNNVVASIWGQTSSFNGLFELDSPFALVAAGRAEAVPRVVVRPSDFADQSPTAEALESRLVRFDRYRFPRSRLGAAFVGGTNPSSRFQGTVDLWISTVALAQAFNAQLGGAPGGPCTILGVFDQFDSTPPYAEGYSLRATGIEVACAADLDDDGVYANGPFSDGAVTIDDLLFFIGAFDAGDLVADLDDGTGTGATDEGVDVTDLLYFLARFEAGC